MQVIQAQFSPMERVNRLKQLNATVEEVGTTPPIYVVRRNGQRLGIGLTQDIAIADAESNIHSYIPKQLKGKGKFAGKAAQEPAKKDAQPVFTIACRKQA